MNLPSSTRRPWILLAVATVAAVSLAACAPTTNPMAHHLLAERPPAGFWLGLWHGAIVWVTFVVSLFDGRVGVYEVFNNGWGYNLGFVLGVACFHGGGASGARRRGRKPPAPPAPPSRPPTPA